MRGIHILAGILSCLMRGIQILTGILSYLKLGNELKLKFVFGYTEI